MQAPRLLARRTTVALLGMAVVGAAVGGEVSAYEVVLAAQEDARARSEEALSTVVGAAVMKIDTRTHHSQAPRHGSPIPTRTTRLLGPPAVTDHTQSFGNRHTSLGSRGTAPLPECSLSGGLDYISSTTVTDPDTSHNTEHAGL